MSLYFGDFALDQERRQLLRGEMPVPLEAKAYELLSLLVARRPRVLSKRALTNLRVVPDTGTSTGYRVDVGPFPGWAKRQEW